MDARYTYTTKLVLLLAATLYLWMNYPKIVNGDYGFGFVLIECAVIALLMRFTRPNRDHASVVNS